MSHSIIALLKIILCCVTIINGSNSFIWDVEPWRRVCRVWLKWRHRIRWIEYIQIEASISSTKFFFFSDLSLTIVVSKCISSVNNNNNVFNILGPVRGRAQGSRTSATRCWLHVMAIRNVRFYRFTGWWYAAFICGLSFALGAGVFGSRASACQLFRSHCWARNGSLCIYATQSLNWTEIKINGYRRISQY